MDRRLDFFTASHAVFRMLLIFYADITRKPYGAGFAQSYKDKGFNFKIKIKGKDSSPAISIGLNDFTGTGCFPLNI